MARVLAAFYPVVEPAEDAFRDRLVELPELFLDERRDLNRPGQGIS